MTVNRTTLLDLPLPVTGTEAGTWGDTTNNGLSQYMDIAIAGMNSLTSANFTAGALTIANTQGDSSATNIAAGSAQYATIKVSSLAVNSTITAPSSNRSYRIINADATYSLTIKASGQTGVTFLPGQTGVVAFNGTDYVIVGVVGAGTATDNAVARFDGTTGEIIQNSVVTIADSTGDVAGVGALSMSGNLTLSGGTANGVLYLNGSKVATSGSGLVFDSSGNLGLGVTPSVYTANSRVFQIDGGANAAEIKLTNNTSGASGATGAIFQMTGNDLYIWNSENSFLSLGTNNTERLRLDSSGNLGLGVTPSAWSANFKAIESAGNSGVVLASANVNPVYLGSNWYSDGTNRYKTTAAATLYEVGAGAFKWYTAPSGTAGNAITFTQAMTLDASGNLGVGTTSPGSFAGTVKLVVGSAATTTTPGAVTVYSGTATYGGLYFADGTVGDQQYRGAVEYNHSTDALLLYSAGTAKATLDSSGNLGLGVTPSAWLPSYKAFQFGGTGTLFGAGGGFDFLSSNAYVGTGDVFRYITTGIPATAYRINSADGMHKWFTAPSGTAGNAITFTQAMTLDASGNLGVGNTSPTTRLTLQGAAGNFTSNYSDKTVRIVDPSSVSSNGFFIKQSWLASDLTSGVFTVGVEASGNHLYALAFATADTERARITSGGDLLVGTTDNSGTSGAGFKTLGGRPVVVNAGSTNATTVYEVYSTGAAAYRFYVGMDGTVYATNTTISAISDQRFKENIQDLDVGLNAVMALKPRKFDWKAGKGKDIKGDRGFIAQEFEQVFPDMIDEWKDPAPDGEESYKSVRADLIPVLIKAIQEQQALITSLTARVALLEGN